MMMVPVVLDCACALMVAHWTVLSWAHSSGAGTSWLVLLGAAPTPGAAGVGISTLRLAAYGWRLLRHGALLVARKVPKGTSEGKDGANETPHNKKTAQRHNKTMIN